MTNRSYIGCASGVVCGITQCFVIAGAVASSPEEATGLLCSRFRNKYSVGPSFFWVEIFDPEVALEAFALNSECPVKGKIHGGERNVRAGYKSYGERMIAYQVMEIPAEEQSELVKTRNVNQVMGLLFGWLGKSN